MSQPESPKERFLSGARAWLNAEAFEWQPYWLAAPCCLLDYARNVQCRFDEDAKKALDELERNDQVRSAKMLYSKDEAHYSQAARLMRGLIHAARAATALVETNWRQGSSLPDNFVKHAVACCAVYQAAWPIGQHDPKSVVEKGPIWGPAELAPNEDLAANALQAVFNEGHLPDLRVPTWLAVRRPIDFLLGGPESPAEEPVQTRVLFYLRHVKSPEETQGEGTVRRLEVFKQMEGH